MELKKAQDVMRVSIPLVRAKMKLSAFKKWCDKHRFEGDLEKAYNKLRKEAGLPQVKKQTENKEG